MRGNLDTMLRRRKAILLLVSIAVLAVAVAAPACAFASARRSPCDARAGVSECRTTLVVSQNAPAPHDWAPTGSDVHLAPVVRASATLSILGQHASLAPGFQAPLRI